MRYSVSILAAVSLVTGLAATDAVGVASRPATVDSITLPHAADRIIVGFKASAGASQRDRSMSDKGVRRHRRISATTTPAVIEVVDLPAGTSVEAAIAKFEADPAVRYAEPDYQLHHQAVSNDPWYTDGSLWGMQGDASSPANQYGTGAAEAWAAGYTGSSNVYVGVIDEGIQVNHPDLAANIWVNPFDAVDGIDNDGNGYIDDTNGWDFYSNNRTVFDGAADPRIDSHGTHVSGTIGGVGGNGTGVAGVNWNVTLISGKFLGPQGGSTSDAIAALSYFIDLKTRHGLNIVATSNSWGGGGSDQAMADAINAAGDAGMLFIAAAGNSGTNNDTRASYPANYQCTTTRAGTPRGYDCVVSVAATNSSGGLASFSQYGATTVDIGAPGVDILSTVPNGSYEYYSGTSMATPHVTGAVALCASINPNLGPAGIRSALMDSAAPTPSLAGKTVTGGRLDVGAMVQRCRPATAPISGSVSGLAVSGTDSSTATLSWVDGVSNEDTFEVQAAVSTSGTCGTFTTRASGAANTTGITVAGLTASTDYCFRVRAANSYNGGGTTAWSNIATGRTATPPPPYTCVPSAYAWVATTGGTSYYMTDDDSKSVALPFAFSFYGTSYATAYISSNGFLRFGSALGTDAYENATIPSTSDPNAFIAPWWDDLDPTKGGSIVSITTGTAPNRRFVVSWNGIPHWASASTSVSFQLVLHESTNRITLAYNDAVTGASGSNYGSGATVGLENAGGTAGTQLSYNRASLASSTAYTCSDGSDLTPPTISTATLPSGVAGTAYSTSLSATGGATPYSWSLASGTLPAGLTLSSSGTISGTPTTAGTSSFTVRVTDGAGLAATKALSLVIAMPLNPPKVSTTSLSRATRGRTYYAALAASGGTTPYRWSLASGTLPSGLTLSTTGVISGTPTGAGTTFTVRVTDARGASATRTYSLVVLLPVPGGFAKSAPVHNFATAQRANQQITWAASTGATSYRYCIDRVNDNLCSSNWIDVGPNRSAVLPTLSARTTYYWQVQAVNASGATAANSGSWWKFTTS